VNKSEEQKIRKIRGEWISQKNKKLFNITLDIHCTFSVILLSAMQILDCFN
jgi:hypothetical protein